MYKQGKPGNILYSAVVGGESFYNGHNILTPPPPPPPPPSPTTKFNVLKAWKKYDINKPLKCTNRASEVTSCILRLGGGGHFIMAIIF